MSRTRSAPSLVAATALLLAAAVAPASTLEEVRAWREAHRRTVVEELASFASLPNVASDADGIRRNVERLVAMLEARGVAARTLEVAGAPPAVFGSLEVPGARRTVVLYAHYDGQPAVAERWTATAPWSPVLKAGADPASAVVPLSALDGDGADGEWRLFGRSVSDDKGPIVAMLSALDALRATGRDPSVNLKFFFEGEEEAGSDHLGEILAAHADLLAADLWLFCDGPVHPSRIGQVVLGVRGVVGLELTVYGPARPLHSGHYGNWAPNPAARLAELLAGLRDGDGRILAAGFYDDVRPLSPAERQAIDALPEIDPALREELLLAETEAGDALLAERIALPALNLRGLAAGEVGAKAANAIPTEARASIDFRLVPDQTPAEVRRRVESHLEAAGWHLVSEEPGPEVRRRYPRIVRLDWGSGYPAQRTPLDLPVSRAVVEVAREAWGGELAVVPSLGGSLPLYLFERELATPLVVLPMVNHDNRQHAADENLRLENLWQGIDLYALVMARLGEIW